MKRINDDALYAYLDGKHKATFDLEHNNNLSMSDYKKGCEEWGYKKYEDEFLNGVKESNKKSQEIRNRKKEEQEFPNTERPRSICKPANQMDVQALWSEMFERYN